MPGAELSEPIVFEPIFMERVWGGRRLETLFGKRLPPGGPIGESWEIVDRPEAQSIVADGPLRGETLHDLWMNRRADVFGNVAEAPRFPLLLKLLDAEDKLSVQVHPPASVARELSGEAKTEFWYLAEAAPGAELYVGLTSGSSRKRFAEAIERGEVERELHRIEVRTGDVMFLPSGRVHAIGAGNVIIEVMQNSDTTYRVFDWNRRIGTKARELHVEKSLRSINFDDREPMLVKPDGESLVRHELFHIAKWELPTARPAAGAGLFVIVCCLSGSVQCAGTRLQPGHFFLLPATLSGEMLSPLLPNTSLLRITSGS